MALSLKMEKGVELLRTTNRSVEDIASELGFISPNYFAAAFYQKMKKTPAEYRIHHKIKAPVRSKKKPQTKKSDSILDLSV